jgi:hypothetical protein
MQYNETKQVCPNCKEQLSVFTELPPDIGCEYSYACPYCKKQATFAGSISISVDSLPEDAVFAKLT